VQTLLISNYFVSYLCASNHLPCAAASEKSWCALKRAVAAHLQKQRHARRAGRSIGSGLMAATKPPENRFGCPLQEGERGDLLMWRAIWSRSCRNRIPSRKAPCLPAGHTVGSGGGTRTPDTRI